MKLNNYADKDINDIRLTNKTTARKMMMMVTILITATSTRP